MMNREERINALKAAGIDTGKFAAFDVPDGATIIIATPDGKECKYDKYGNRIDEILKKVKDVGYIKADPHFRRWVMAQTFDILKYGSMAEYIRHHKGGYYYQFEQTLDELDAIVKLSGKAKEDRAKFFTVDVVIDLCEDYLAKLHRYIDSLPEKKHKGVPYKRIKGFGNVHCKDIEGIVFSKLESALFDVKEMNNWSPYYCGLARNFRKFVNNMVKIDLYDENLCEAWLSAYKGAGAYYTLMGLIKFHDCRVFKHEGPSWNCTRTRLNLDDSIQAVEDKVKQILNKSYYRRPDWYLLYGMLREVVEDNHFDFKARMREIYG